MIGLLGTPDHLPIFSVCQTLAALGYSDRRVVRRAGDVPGSAARCQGGDEQLPRGERRDSNGRRAAAAPPARSCARAAAVGGHEPDDAAEERSRRGGGVWRDDRVCAPHQPRRGRLGSNTARRGRGPPAALHGALALSRSHSSGTRLPGCELQRCTPDGCVCPGVLAAFT